uniref:Uncharacterized protein n=1 Tax=Poecilia mexicana TaxID=48701 RepID=A0A3B3XBL7_9TELE
MGNGLSEQPKFSSNMSFFQSFHIAILGLDSAGKTTVLYRLQFNEFVNTVPTKGFNSEKVKTHSFALIVFTQNALCYSPLPAFGAVSNPLCKYACVCKAD